MDRMRSIRMGSPEKFTDVMDMETVIGALVKLVFSGD
jgi:hypothetical protein